MARRSGSRTAAAATVLTALIVAGCSSPTPLCEKADGLAKQAKLAAAADAYAEAKRRGDGTCADDGLDAVSAQRAKAFAAVARGRAAEKARDLAGARTEYRTALATDSGNGDAATGLLRVTRRPTALGPLWITAQRLHDEGYDEEARAEIVTVLKEHPGETVPEGLAPLASPRPAPAAPAAVRRVDPPTGGGSAPWQWLPGLAALLLAAGVLALAYRLWETQHQLDRRLAAQGYALADRLATVAHRVQALRDRQDALHATPEELFRRLEDLRSRLPLRTRVRYHRPEGDAFDTDLRLVDVGVFWLGEDRDRLLVARVIVDARKDGPTAATLRNAFADATTRETFAPRWERRTEFWLAPHPDVWHELLLGEPHPPDATADIARALPLPGDTAGPDLRRIVQFTALVVGAPSRYPLLASACLRSLVHDETSETTFQAIDGMVQEWLGPHDPRDILF
jgi:tetratricopeptide (TPR) repeat protein